MEQRSYWAGPAVDLGLDWHDITASGSPRCALACDYTAPPKRFRRRRRPAATNDDLYCPTLSALCAIDDADKGRSQLAHTGKSPSPVLGPTALTTECGALQHKSLWNKALNRR